ncbi:uncharacterized protein VTP21DRAFT_9220 [Calcarisporiella thermophila]|uniref:uncharacterized protein n=1 Tax=Calcarisporiella thermophila TaxID=911321 RepID=UPI0037449FEB
MPLAHPSPPAPLRKFPVSLSQTSRKLRPATDNLNSEQLRASVSALFLPGRGALNADPPWSPARTSLRPPGTRHFESFPNHLQNAGPSC